MTQNPPIVFDVQWQAKHEARNKMLLELKTLEVMAERARTHDARVKLSHQIKDKKRAAHLLLVEMDAIRSVIRRRAHEATMAADRGQKLLFDGAFNTVCKANLSTSVFEALIQEADRVVKGSAPQPVTFVGHVRQWLKKKG